MALTPERIRELWENYSPTQGIESFARSVEADGEHRDPPMDYPVKSVFAGGVNPWVGRSV